ncbi:MAG: TatD family deoxyribonuclease [Candidatus Pacebacteria bacterium]|nr:TatD family deoxyribonuclease [Candidatus Paceibacterota bacterium]
MENHIFDSHCHIQFPAYATDREAVIERAIDSGIKMIAVGTQKSTSIEAINLAKKYPNIIFATIGFHPNHLSENWHHDKNEQGENQKEVFNYQDFNKLAAEKEVIAIGECGLDYYRSSKDKILANTEQENQKEVFIQQIEIAEIARKPLMIHSRPSNKSSDAYLDSLDILKKTKFSLSVIFHFYVGGIEITQKLVEFGANFTFGGVITFSHDYDEVIRSIPIDRILIETDAPYVAPMSNRGKRNEPAFILETYKKIAELKGISYDEVIGIVGQNVKRIFNI